MGCLRDESPLRKIARRRRDDRAEEEFFFCAMLTGVACGGGLERMKPPMFAWQFGGGGRGTMNKGFEPVKWEGSLHPAEDNFLAGRS